MLAPTIVYDLDGTLADTAEDLVATLNWLLGREGLAPIKVESAGSLVGAGARALIKRGFATSGRTLNRGRGRGAVHRLPWLLQRPYRRSQPALSRRRRGARGFCARWLAAGGLHQQDRSVGQTPDRKARESPSDSPSSAARTRSASASRTPGPFLRPSPLRAARGNGPSWSGIQGPTSRPRVRRTSR